MLATMAQTEREAAERERDVQRLERRCADLDAAREHDLRRERQVVAVVMC